MRCTLPICNKLTIGIIGSLWDPQCPRELTPARIPKWKLYSLQDWSPCSLHCWERALDGRSGDPVTQVLRIPVIVHSKFPYGIWTWGVHPSREVKAWSMSAWKGNQQMKAGTEEDKAKGREGVNPGPPAPFTTKSALACSTLLRVNQNSADPAGWLIGADNLGGDLGMMRWPLSGWWPLNNIMDTQ